MLSMIYYSPKQFPESFMLREDYCQTDSRICNVNRGKLSEICH